MNMYELCIKQGFLNTVFDNRVIHDGKEIVYVGDARYYENVYEVEYDDGSKEFLEHESEVELIPR